MERITPIDLESARFPLVRKGYDTNAVDAMLRTASAELESMRRELAELRQRHEVEKKELELFRTKESTAADALILAQKTADDYRQQHNGRHQTDERTDLVERAKQRRIEDMSSRAQSN